MENLLEVDSLATDMGQFHILTGVSFTVPEHQITVLLGRNGAGKTTTLCTLMGYLPPRSGQVRLRGESLQGGYPHGGLPVRVWGMCQRTPTFLPI
ncbi:ATP-binding cassette domain-containing protein [Alicyclobacillaceae bacterium I2511]|nr:ATP-binding cassette domain-containing protein [Alicyclobacillaceae bacterium I2511]